MKLESQLKIGKKNKKTEEPATKSLTKAISKNKKVQKHAKKSQKIVKF